VLSISALRGDLALPMSATKDGFMTEEPNAIVESAERLCATLERIGDALVALDIDTLLETEETLGQLLVAIAQDPCLENRTALDPLACRGRAALLQCRRLGGSFTSVARPRLPLHTGIETYGRAVNT
jgi:hypothetical protein